MAIGGDRLLRVGTRKQVDSIRTRATRVIDVAGGCIAPGFHDAHAHLVPTAIARAELDLHGLAASEIEDALRRRAATVEPGRWIVGRGYDPDRLAELGPRPRDVLDAVCPAHPVLLRAHDYHSVALNTEGLTRIGFVPVPSEVDRALVPADAEGRPIGLLLEELANVAGSRAGDRTAEEQVAGTLAVVADLHRAGITALHEMSGHYHADVLTAADQTGELHLDVFATLGPSELSAPRGHGRSVRIFALKAFLDGALGSRSAHLLEPYDDSCAAHRGVELLTPTEARELVRQAAALGLPTCLHAIGDAAVRSALDALSSSPGLRHRVEHAELIHPDDVPRFAEAGVVASVQPVHLLEDARLVRERLAGRTGHVLPLQDLLATGATVVLGSDTPVEHFDVLRSIRSAVERRGLDGDVIGADQRLTVAQALRSHTTAAAWAVGAESEQGRVEEGRLASLAVLSHDPTTEPDALADTQVVVTVHRGRVVHCLGEYDH